MVSKLNSNPKHDFYMSFIECCKGNIVMKLNDPEGPRATPVVVDTIPTTPIPTPGKTSFSILTFFPFIHVLNYKT